MASKNRMRLIRKLSKMVSNQHPLYFLHRKNICEMRLMNALAHPIVFMNSNPNFWNNFIFLCLSIVADTAIFILGEATGAINIDNTYELASSHYNDCKDLRDDEDIVINQEWILNKLSENENE